MAEFELIAKSISRETAKIDLTETKKITRLYGENIDSKEKRFKSRAKTNREISTRVWDEDYSPDGIELISKAANIYSDYAQHIRFIEGVGNVGVENIRKAVEEHINYTNNTPIVLIDYIQLLAPYNAKMTDKQNMDKNVVELKRISRDFKTPVIGISSLNRDGYKDKVIMAAFKESGAIEYSSDILIGLNLKGAGAAGFDVEAAKKKQPRDIVLSVLKNRNAETGGTINYKYYSAVNLFLED
jgi:replicative DNA helicase